jgi:hypothetical protein
MQCKNCHTELDETNSFCPECGAKVIRNRLTIKNLFQHFSEQFLNYDNKFLQTFISLFNKPEDVIGGYIKGTRKKYVNVISYFAIALTLSGLQMFILSKFFPEAIDVSNMSTEGTEEFQKRNMQFVQEYQSIIMMLYVPIYALMSKIVFFNIKKYNYTEHLVIYMYLLAQATIISSIITIIAVNLGQNIGTIGLGFVIPFQILYSAYCLKRLFKLSILGITLRTLFFLLVLSIFFILFSIAMVAGIYIFGDIEMLRNTQQTAMLFF